MKKYLSVILSLLVLSSFFTACGKKEVLRKKNLETKINWKSGEWYDKGNTFALKVYALPVANYINKTQAILTCTKALKLNAGSQITAYFNGIKIHTAAETKNARLQKMSAFALSQGIIKDIRLYNVKMQEENPSQGCSAIAVISRKDLKKEYEKGKFKF